LLSESGEGVQERAIKAVQNVSAPQSSNTQYIISFESGSGTRAVEKQSLSACSLRRHPYLTFEPQGSCTSIKQIQTATVYYKCANA